MIYFPTLISIIEVLLVTVPVLLTVAYVTVAERKTMASMQRRLGPNAVGYLGLLQALKTNKNITRSYHTTSKLYNSNDTTNISLCMAEAIYLEAIQ
jgi:NADH:ubiquinone oxidoreductase subunit H